jgi:AbiA family abortive infection protein
MFGISYDVWKEICEMYFSISQGSLKAYLQWFPYTKISDTDKELIKSKKFFDKYIDSGGFVLFPEVMRHSENFIQKGDGSFRNSSLISPLLFLVLQSIGKEISCRYIPERPNDIKVFYAGNYSQSRAKYGYDYDNFYKTINTYAQEYQYFIKTDITNFYGNINVNELMNRINEVCNRSTQEISQSEILLMKELLLFCGNGNYPLIENSLASSYLATVIYLDKIDTDLHDLIKTKVDNIKNFQMIRYVDDLYILFTPDTDYEDNNRTYNAIKNGYSSILKDHGLSLNVGKCALKKSGEINESLKRSLYDEYINGKKHDLGELFNDRICEFLKGVYKCVYNHGITYEEYLNLIEQYFHSNDIELTAMSVYNYFVYENQVELKTPETTKELLKIIRHDISFLSIDPKRLSVMVMQSDSDSSIKAMLNQLFIRYRAGIWNSYDTTIAIAYLIQSKFQHLDLLEILREKSPDLYSYYKYSCKTSFLCQLRPKKWSQYLQGIGNDRKALFLYFMYICEMNRSNYLGAYAYYKSFFDRVSADMAFLSTVDTECKKPNYHAYYKSSAFKKLYGGIQNCDSIISKAQRLRNQNPLCHSSAELIESNDSSKDLEKSQEELDYLLDSYASKHYRQWITQKRWNK